MGSWSQREGCGCAGDSHSTAPPPRRSPRLFLPLLPPVILPRLTVHSASISMVTVLRTMSSLPLLPFLALWPSTSTVTVLRTTLSLPHNTRICMLALLAFKHTASPPELPHR